VCIAEACVTVLLVAVLLAACACGLGYYGNASKGDGACTKCPANSNTTSIGNLDASAYVSSCTRATVALTHAYTTHTCIHTRADAQVTAGVVLLMPPSNLSRACEG
jgi:hypothetical protein